MPLLRLDHPLHSVKTPFYRRLTGKHRRRRNDCGNKDKPVSDNKHGQQRRESLLPAEIQPRRTTAASLGGSEIVSLRPSTATGRFIQTSVALFTSRSTVITAFCGCEVALVAQR